jgi:hypothetical protein
MIRTVFPLPLCVASSAILSAWTLWVYMAGAAHFRFVFVPAKYLGESYQIIRRLTHSAMSPQVELFHDPRHGNPRKHHTTPPEYLKRTAFVLSLS